MRAAAGPRGHPHPDARNVPSPIHAWALACAAAALAVAVFHGTLDYGLSQDDFAGLARASGFAPRLEGPWRWLSHQFAFDLLGAIAGRDAFAYKAVALAWVALLSGTLAFMLARRFGIAAAILGSVYGAANPNLYTATYWFSAHGDVAATLCALMAFAATRGRGLVRWLAVPLFAVALMWKESVILLPVAIAAFAWRSPGARRPWRDPVVLALVATGAAFALDFMARNRFGVLVPSSPRAPYAIGSAGAIVENLLTYVGWTIPVPLPWVAHFADAVDPPQYAVALVAMAAWVAGGWIPALRARGWLEGGIAFSAMLLPVLPLAHHTYHYYLTPALPAAAFLIAAAADAAMAAISHRRPGVRRAAGVVAFGLAGALALNGAFLVRRIERMPFAIEGLRADPTVDRALIAARVQAGLREAKLVPGTRLAFWSPASQSAGAPGAYAMRNVRAALLDGLAVRVMFPAVDSVEFVNAFDGRDDPWQWAIYLPDGRVRVGSSMQLRRELDALPSPPPARP